jgi:SAM-dependent methyltransferase
LTSVTDDGFIEKEPGLFVPTEAVRHREEHYDSDGFETLARIQEEHFWYRGRHRFLLHATRRYTAKPPSRTEPRCAIDLGAGCGGWIAYLHKHSPALFDRLALGDSSLEALHQAKAFVPESISRYQVDLMNLPWDSRWDAAFLLDVLEHVPDDVHAIEQVAKSLRPGGRLFVTVPALDFFWSHNDDWANHFRRYNKDGFCRLADVTGLELLRTRYFMFFLSPLLYLARRKPPAKGKLSQEEIRAHQNRTHQTPARPLNAILSMVFSAESPLGHYLPFPWGTSLLGVFGKPE